MRYKLLCVGVALQANACTYDESYLACFDAPETDLTGLVAFAEVTPPWEGNGCILGSDSGATLDVEGNTAMVPLCVGSSPLNLYLQPGVEVGGLYEWYGGEAHSLPGLEASVAESCPDELVQYRLPAFTSDRAYVEVTFDGDLNVWLTPRDTDEWRDELW